MNCQALRDAIVDVGRGRDVGPGSAAAVDSHVSHCASCAVLLARERELTAGLAALARSSASARASDAVERALLEAFSGQQLARRGSDARRWLGLAAGIVAAMGTAAIGTAMWWAWPQTGDRRESAGPQLVDTDRRRPGPGVSPSPTVDRGNSARGPHRPSSTETPAPYSTADGFVLLPTAVGLPDFESGEILRIEVPVTSLPAYGLEIAPDARRMSVEADFLVGQDGQPRAIRLVTSTENDSQQP